MIHHWDRARTVLQCRPKSETVRSSQQIFQALDRCTETDLRDEIVGGVSLAIVIHQNRSHPDIRNDRWVLLLQTANNKSELSQPHPGSEQLTEYSNSTKLLVSRQLRSNIVLNDSPSLFLIFRPDLSFFFFEERTLVNVMGMLEGNWRGGRWKARQSDLVRRVLY